MDLLPLAIHFVRQTQRGARWEFAVWVHATIRAAEAVDGQWFLVRSDETRSEENPEYATSLCYGSSWRRT